MSESDPIVCEKCKASFCSEDSLLANQLACPHCGRVVGEETEPTMEYRLEEEQADEVEYTVETTTDESTEPVAGSADFYLERAERDLEEKGAAKPKDMSETMQSLWGQAKKFTSKLAKETSLQAQITTKRAQQANIRTTKLPRLYVALGKSLYAGRRFENEFKDLYASLDDVRDRLEKLRAATNDAEAQTVADRFKASTDKVKDTVAAKKLEVTRFDLFKKLGRLCYQNSAESWKAPEVQHIQHLENRLAELEAEVAKLAASP